MGVGGELILKVASHESGLVIPLLCEDSNRSSVEKGQFQELLTISEFPPLVFRDVPLSPCPRLQPQHYLGAHGLRLHHPPQLA